MAKRRTSGEGPRRREEPPRPEAPPRAAPDSLGGESFLGGETSYSLDERVRTIALVVIAVVVGGAALHWLASVLVAFALASFLAIALSPMVEGLASRTHLSRPFAVAATMALGALVLVLLGLVVALSVGQLQAELPRYEDNLIALLQRAVDSWPGLPALFGAEPGADAGAILELVLEGVIETTQRATSMVLGVVGALSSQGFSVLIFLMFLLLEHSRERGGLADLLDTRVKRYVAVKVFSSAATGLLVGVTLALLGIDAALVFGLLTFLLNFIPTLGSVVAVLLPLPLVLAGDHGIGVMVAALLVPTAIQFGIGQIWENKKLGDEFDLRASVVLLSLVVFGKLFGLVGMVMAVPITAVVKALLADWPMTAGFARALGGASNMDEAPEHTRGRDLA